MRRDAVLVRQMRAISWPMASPGGYTNLGQAAAGGAQTLPNLARSEWHPPKFHVQSAGLLVRRRRQGPCPHVRPPQKTDGEEKDEILCESAKVRGP